MHSNAESGLDSAPSERPILRCSVEGDVDAWPTSPGTGEPLMGLEAESDGQPVSGNGRGPLV